MVVVFVVIAAAAFFETFLEKRSHHVKRAVVWINVGEIEINNWMEKKNYRWKNSNNKLVWFQQVESDKYQIDESTSILMNIQSLSHSVAASVWQKLLLNSSIIHCLRSTSPALPLPHSHTHSLSLSFSVSVFRRYFYILHAKLILLKTDFLRNFRKHAVYFRNFSKSFRCNLPHRHKPQAANSIVCFDIPFIYSEYAFTRRFSIRTWLSCCFTQQTINWFKKSSNFLIYMRWKSMKYESNTHAWIHTATTAYTMLWRSGATDKHGRPSYFRYPYLGEQVSGRASFGRRVSHRKRKPTKIVLRK